MTSDIDVPQWQLVSSRIDGARLKVNLLNIGNIIMSLGYRCLSICDYSYTNITDHSVILVITGLAMVKRSLLYGRPRIYRVEGK